ncbi:hypothetical protein Tco_0864403, partial [Tanacetum coccineum]
LADIFTISPKALRNSAVSNSTPATCMKSIVHLITFKLSGRRIVPSDCNPLLKLRKACRQKDDIMVDLNIPTNDTPVEQAPAVAPPTRTDDQILPLSKWVPIGQSNCVLYLDEQWFNLHKDILRDALDITPANDNYPFVALPSSDTVIEYVNTLGYPSTLRNVSAMYVNACYQPWRVILSMINMCLTGKTAGYDKPRHPVLQILWGIIHRSNIDYAERIWEEFVQSIQTFLTHRKNLATVARGNKKTVHLLIPSVRFTKLIIHHLITKHNIHPRTGSPLHYSHEESILNTLRFVGNNGRETFGMPIPDALLTDEIKGSPSYGDYKEHVAKYQQFLDAKRGKAEEGGATESSDATKVTKPKAAKRRKQKVVKETPDESSPAKRSKGGLVEKTCKSKSPLKLVDEPSDEGVPVEVQEKGKEKFVDEQAVHDLLTLQNPTKKSPVDQFIFQRRPPMHIEPTGHADSPSLDVELPLTDSETKSGEEVPVINVGDQDEGQAKPNPGEQDEGQVGPIPGIQDEGQAGSNPGDAVESQPQQSHEVHAGPNREHMDLEATDASSQQKLEQMDEEFTITAYLNVQENLKLPTEDQFFVEKPHEKKSGKTNAETEGQSMVSVPIHQDTSSVPPMTTLVIDLTTMQSDSPLPTSIVTTSIITTTTTSLPPPPQPQQSTTDPILVSRIGELEQHMADLIQNNLALEKRLDKQGTQLYNLENLNIPHKVSQVVDEIVTDVVDWAMQAPLQARFRDLPTVNMKEILQQRMFEDNSYQAHEVHNDLYEALQKSLELDYSNQRLADQEEARKKKRKKCAAPRTPPPSPPPPPPPPAGAFGTSGILGTSGSSQLPPPPPPPSTGTSGSAQQASSKAPSSSKPAASTHRSMALTTSDTRFESTGFTAAQELSPTDSLMQDDTIPDEQVHLSDDEDSGNEHLPKADSRKDWWKPLPEEERAATLEPAWIILSSNVSDVENNWASALVSTSETPAENSLLAKTGDMTTFMKWYCRQMNKTELTQADFEGQAYDVVKAFYLDVIHLQFQMEECHKMLTAQVDWTNPEGDQVRIDVNRPLPLSGPPGHVTIQPQFFFNKDLEYLRYGSKGSNPALSISKMKVASYPDFGLELLVPEQMWIDDVCTYDISGKYGISHWWFNRQKFYIDRHDSLSRRKDVRTHMRILSVVRIKAYSRYGYEYLSEIFLRRADFQEHTITERDFKNLYPSDFEDLNLLLLQGHLDHLLGYEFKHDYTIIESPRAVVFPVDNNDQKIMRFNEIYKFSDGTLTRILEALDYRVKEFKVKRLNPGMNTRFWTEKDVTRSKEFIAAIERRLKTRRIYQNLECFVGGRVRDIDYRLLQRTE